MSPWCRALPLSFYILKILVKTNCLFIYLLGGGFVVSFIPKTVCFLRRDNDTIYSFKVFFVDILLTPYTYIAPKVINTNKKQNIFKHNYLQLSPKLTMTTISIYMLILKYNSKVWVLT